MHTPEAKCLPHLRRGCRKCEAEARRLRSERAVFETRSQVPRGRILLVALVLGFIVGAWAWAL